MGNSLNKGRAIKVANPTRRVTKEELSHLKEAFSRIQDAQLISDFQFHLEVLGPQVPESIAMKIFTLFTSDEQYPDAMNFEDLVACYVVFRHGQPEELAQVCFELMKMTNGNNTQILGPSEYISRDNVQTYTEKLISQNEQLVHSFYAKTEFDPRLPIRKGNGLDLISTEDFVAVFKKVQNLPMFTWVPKLIEGYSRDCMNMDEGRSVDMMKRLTIIQHERARNDAEKLGFTSKEHDSMQEFFNREMKKNDAKSVMTTIEIMFKDVANERLKKYLIDALTKHKALDFKSLSNLAFTICKESDYQKKLHFLYDIFSSYSETIKKNQMKDFGEIFDLGSNFFQVRGASSNCTDFIEDIKSTPIDFTLYEKCKYTIIAMLGLQPQDDEEEMQSISAVLNFNPKIEAYIFDHLDEEDTFYIIEKSFFTSWSAHVGFSIDKNSFQVKKGEMSKIMDNLSLLEAHHQFRMKEFTYGQDFIIVPRFVFFPLSKWYSCNKVIERKVIKYNLDKNQSLNIFKSKRNSISQTISLQNVPENFYKSVGDVTYELEVYPKIIYFEKITDKGERPHLKAISNKKIDQAYMKKHMKPSDKLPFFELQISRKATFEEVLKQMSAQLNDNFKRGRLWIEDQVISGAKLEETLEQFGISIGQIVYVEYATNSNQWPTDNVAASQKSSATSPGGENQREVLKTNGLYNLGNTCYMNSALQCLANTKFFNEFFIKEKRYLKQMNLKSKHGHQGELAQNFAFLMQKMWAPSHMVVPRQFKNCISQLSEQFQGYEQQDSQEFLSFLIDGLHEELNLRLEKPYLENPDSDNRNVLELGLESWSNSLRRDWSFIFFLFFGQLKSTLNCQTCDKVSVTFDNFTSIPLSLPEPSKILINIIVYRLPSEIKALLNGISQVKHETMQRADSFRSDEALTTIPNAGLEHATRHTEEGDQFQESIKSFMNNQPIRISLRVDKDVKISQIITQICGVKEVNVDLTSNKSTLCLYAQAKGVIRGIFNPDYRLTAYHVASNEIEAIEIITKTGRDTIKDHYFSNQLLLGDNLGSHLTCLMKQTEKTVEDPISQQLTSSSTNAPKSKNSQRNQPKSNLGRDPNYGMKIEKCNLFNSYNVAIEKYQEFEDNLNFPSEIFVVAYHRRFVKKTHSFFCPYQPQLISSPLIFQLPLKPTGRRVYEEVWAIASNILKKTSIYHDKRNRWWEQKNWEDKVAAHKEEVFKPFILKIVDRSGYTCSQCNWLQMCSGCILPPGEEFIEDFFKKIHLAIEWHSSLIEEDYNQEVNEVIHHASTEDKEVQDDGFINLEDCLRKFHEVEEIGTADHIYCGNCKKPQGHFKKLEIFRPPPILIFQLKRFKFSNTFRNKLTTLVEFPLYNLDLSTFVNEQNFIKEQKIDLNYDLYAMINHYGSLHFGHYISVVKNLQENQWYQYDDSTRTLIQEEQIQKESAYILFYIRKDVQAKDLDEIFPSIKDLFPGKPVSTEKGEAFIIEKNEDGTFKIQFEKGKSSETVSIDLIQEEKDSNEITYDAKQLQEIESHKKGRLIETMKNRKSKRGRCRAMCSTFRMSSSFLSTGSKSVPSGKSTQTKGVRRGSIKSQLARGGQCIIF